MVVRMGIPDAAVINLESLPEDFICSICQELMRDPVQTECQHLFCLSCLETSVATSRSCPLDRTQFSHGTVFPLLRDRNPPMFRMYARICVRCPASAVGSGCPWVGTADGFDAHMQGCRQPDAAADLRSQIGRLTQERDELRRELAQARQQAAENERNVAQAQQTAQGAAQRTTVLHGYDPNCKYGRFECVRLCKLIVQILEWAPPGVDSNRIFNCVRNIHQDFTRDYSDNPEFFELDVALLLAAC
jgi:hypothetical protein